MVQYVATGLFEKSDKQMLESHPWNGYGNWTMRNITSL